MEGKDNKGTPAENSVPGLEYEDQEQKQERQEEENVEAINDDEAAEESGEEAEEPQNPQENGDVEHQPQGGRRGKRKRKRRKAQEEPGQPDGDGPQELGLSPPAGPTLYWSLPLFIVLLTPILMSLTLAVTQKRVESDLGAPDDDFLPFVGRPMWDVQACLTLDTWTASLHCLAYDAKRAIAMWQGKRLKRMVPSIRATCVTSCEGRPDGFYQSCLGCDVRALCYYGHFYDNVPCTARTRPGRRARPLFWDDYEKRCVRASSTCDDGERCVSSCEGRPDGRYQSCGGCDVYAACRSGRLEDGLPCPSGQVWNDVTKTCGTVWTTCP